MENKRMAANRITQNLGTRVFLLVGLAAQLLTACGSLNTIKYYSPSIEEKAIPVEMSQDGIAFPVGDICLHVSEGGSKYIQPRAMTLVGVPVIPVDLSSNEHRTSYFDVSLWLIPERGNTTYSFDALKIEIQFSNGVRKSPSVIQVSRFKTSLELDHNYFFKQDKIETISYPEHWGPKPITDFHEPINLWDWARFKYRFEKPDQSLAPKKLYILGVLMDGKVQDVPVIDFSFVSEFREAFPGRFADGTWITDQPDKACRKLQKLERTS